MYEFSEAEMKQQANLNRYMYKAARNIEFGLMKRPSVQGYITQYEFHIPAMSIRVEKPE